MRSLLKISPDNIRASAILQWRGLISYNVIIPEISVDFRSSCMIKWTICCFTAFPTVFNQGFVVVVVLLLKVHGKRHVGTVS